ncbi:MAG: choice-of-anchor J domain-containing protein [Lachnoclostridium sp.]|nr:choice-of-anchor J domain-containing protein [Lachnoclostridium sp.]
MNRFFTLFLSAAVAVTSMAAPVGPTDAPLSALPVVPPAPEMNWKQMTLQPASSTLRQPLSSSEVSRARFLNGKPSRVISENVPELRGWIIWPAAMLGLYTLPKTDDANFVPVGSDAYGVINGGGYDDGHGTYHGVYYEQGSESVLGMQIMEFDSQTFSLTNVITLDVTESLGIIAMDVDLDPTSGAVYGCYMTDDAHGYCWGRGDYVTGERTFIASLSSRMVAVGCDKDGQYYGLLANGTLVKVDKTTGSFTTVGQTSVPTEGYLTGYAAGGAVDRTTGKMYVTYITPDNDCGVYEIDLTTAESTKAVGFKTPAMVLAPFFTSEVAGLAPAAPALSISAPQGTLEAAYTIVMPSKLENSTTLTGELDWELYADGVLAASGKAQAGATVNGVHTLAAPGMVNFTASAANAAGKSAVASVTVFIGNGVPAAPADVKAQWNNGTVKISWSPVTIAVDGGYIDESTVKYTVTLDGATIASDLSATSYNYPLVEPDMRTSYQFAVKAVNDGIESQTAEAELLWLGAYNTPFSSDFTPLAYGDDLSSLGYTIVDANNDGRTWSGMGMGKGVRYYYSSSEAADDWLITPALYMEAGKVYSFSVFVSNYGASDEERFEVKAGMGTSPADMTLDVIPPTTVFDTNGFYVTGSIKPDVTGKWNIGIHCISDPYKYYLIVRDLSVSAGMAAATPAGVTDLTLTPEVSGLLTLTGKFKLPTLDVTGKALTGNVTAKVTRGEELVATLSGAPGAELSFTDNSITAKGTYSYSVTTTLNGAEGVTVSASAFVGPYAAVAPTSVKVSETTNPGTVELNWDAVNKDINGYILDPANVTYMIYRIVAHSTFDVEVTPLLDQPLAATSATLKVLADNESQQFMQFSVAALNRGEQGEECVSELIPVGNAYKLPVTYSGTASQDSYIERISTAGTGFWYVLSPDKLTNAPSTVATDDYYACYGGAAELYGDLYTGKIDLTTAEHPEVSFYTYKFPTNHDYFVGEDINFIEVIALADNQMALVGTANHATMVEGRWTKVRFDLSAYKGKNIQLIFRAVTKSGYYTLLDEATVKETPALDLVALYMDAPAETTAGTPFNVNAHVANHGYKDASAFSIRFSRNGSLIEERNVDALPAGQETTICFDQTISHFDADNSSAVYSAEVVMSGDELLDNNAFVDVTVLRPISKLPRVTDLAGEAKADGNHLSWTKYTLDALQPEEMTEDFEAASPWTFEYGDWTFASESSSPVAYIYGYTFPNVVAYESQFAYAVINNLGVESELPSVSGNQYIASMCKSDRQANNDWAISPLLSGQAQTISFWAKGISSYYPEKFEVYYTTLENPDFEDFIAVTSKPEEPSAIEWEKFEYQLPEGAMHFAVRCVSADCYLLMLDDFTFTPDPLLGAPEIAGYDVYRDGTKLIAVTEGEYLDVNPEGTNTYHIVARYDKGDSELSNEVSLLSAKGPDSGIAGVNAAAAKAYVTGKTIVVENADNLDVAIYSADGRTLHLGKGNCRLTVQPAVYVVTAGSLTTKLIVR